MYPEKRGKYHGVLPNIMAQPKEYQYTSLAICVKCQEKTHHMTVPSTSLGWQPLARASYPCCLAGNWIFNTCFYFLAYVKTYIQHQHHRLTTDADIYAIVL